jgi:hypothetical protein
MIPAVHALFLKKKPGNGKTLKGNTPDVDQQTQNLL